MTEPAAPEHSVQVARARRDSRRWGHLPVAYKLGFTMAALIALAMTGFGLILLSHQSGLLRSQMEGLGATVAVQLADSSQELVLSGDDLALSAQVNNLVHGPRVKGAAIFDRDGKPLASAGDVPSVALGQLTSAPHVQGEARVFDWQTDAARQRVSFLAPIRFRDLDAGYALITFSGDLLSEGWRETVNGLVVATILMCLLALGVSLLVGKRLSRPIYDLMDATRAVGEGQFDVRLRERRHDEIGYLMDAFNHMGQGLLEKSQVESVFSRFVPKNVAQQMLANLDQIQLGGQRVVGSVLFADIVDYTGISEKLPPEEVAQLLNDYFGLMTQAAMLHGGMVDKFIGDCAMIVFGVPEADPRHHLKAIGCAVFLQKVLAEMNRHRVSKGLPAVEVRMGVNSGEMLAGNLGSDQQMQYTVVGDSVNLASRLSSVAEANQIVVREDLLEWPEVDARFETRRHRRLRLRGMEGEVTTWLVLDTRGAWKRAMERRVDEFLAERGAA